jgi:hypothetical protein
MGVRRPWVAGSFYPASPGHLKKTIKESFTHPLGPGKLPQKGAEERKIIGIICPHAGLAYSGPIAAHSYYSLASEKTPSAVIILGPNHTGLGSPVSIWGEGAWETPLGKVGIHKHLAKKISEASDIIELDESAHFREHSIEVQLPFLQNIYRETRIVPICMRYQDLATSRVVGRAIAESVAGMDILILASTDLTHMETKESAEWKDFGVLKRMESMNEEALQYWVHSQQVSMCGYGPVSATLVAAKKMGATKTQVLAYSTSGDITEDMSAVVGYVSAKILR